MRVDITLSLALLTASVSATLTSPRQRAAQFELKKQQISAAKNEAAVAASANLAKRSDAVARSDKPSYLTPKTKSMYFVLL